MDIQLPMKNKIYMRGLPTQRVQSPFGQNLKIRLTFKSLFKKSSRYFSLNFDRMNV